MTNNNNRGERLLKKANPNRHGLVTLKEVWDTIYHDDGTDEKVTRWYVKDPFDDEYDEGTEFARRDQAEYYFDERVKELANTPNWEAQARYDEEHGTDNGYDPIIERYRREY